MIEKIILDYLSEVLTVPVYMEEPKAPPESYVVIEKTGSGRNNMICRAMIAVQSYGGTLYEAAVLNDEVKQAMYDAVEINEISRCELNSDYNFTDPETHRYRYQAVFDIVHY